MRPRLSGWVHLRPLLGDRVGPIVVLAVASVVAGVTEAGILAMLSSAAAGLVDQNARLHIVFGPLNLHTGVGTLVAFALALALIRLGLQGVISIIPARIATDLQARLRRDLFAAYTRASWSEKSRDREGHLQELVTNQIVAATSGALQATAMVIAFMSFLVLVLAALALNVVGAMIVLVAAGLLFVLMRPLSSMGHRYARAASSAALDYAGGVNESVRLAQESQVFGVEAAQREQVDVLVAAQQRVGFYNQLLLRLVPGVYQSTIYVLIAAALGALYLTGARHVASLGAVVLLLVRAGSYGQQIQSGHQVVRQAAPYLERLSQVEHGYTESTPIWGNRRLPVVQTLAFESVSFAYDFRRPVLRDISFTVGRHETVGIVGPTGAGKSTLVQVLLGLRDPSSGRYLVNGVPAGEYRREDWARVVAYLPQEPRLLHASVADNIRFLRDLDDDAVKRAAELAGIHSDIMKWPKAYDTIVGPRADAVSGGQQQRICLARALAARPSVLVLDEPTSALDPRTEILIRESLAALKDQLTLFVVAHRLSTLDICNRVIVIVDGRLEAFDTASALLSNSPYYRSAAAISANPDPPSEVPRTIWS